MDLAELETFCAAAKDGRGDPARIPELLGALRDPDGRVRRAASTGLGWLALRSDLRDERLLEPAVALLEDPVGLVRHDGAWILESLAQRGVLPSARSLPRLVANLGHDDADTRAASAFALAALAKAGLADACALEPLRQQLASAEGTERRAVEAALAALAAL